MCSRKDVSENKLNSWIFSTSGLLVAQDLWLLKDARKSVKAKKAFHLTTMGSCKDTASLESSYGCRDGEQMMGNGAVYFTVGLRSLSSSSARARNCARAEESRSGLGVGSDGGGGDGQTKLGMASSLIFASSGRVGFDNASCGSGRASTFASFLHFFQTFLVWICFHQKWTSIKISCQKMLQNMWKNMFFGENLGLRAKVRAAGWCEPQKTDVSLRAFGFGPGSMPSLSKIVAIFRFEPSFSDLTTSWAEPAHEPSLRGSENCA